MGKRCPSCKEVKSLSDFHRNRSMKDGHNSYCKPCWTIKVYQWREANPENWEASREKTRQKRNRSGQENNIWRKGRKDAERAHNVVAWAVKTKKLRRPESCDECGSSGRVEAHHEDYTLPLEVRWLCPACHRAQHLRVGYTKR